jgi:Zn-dependent peptidase ImmA (M78 family)
MASYDGVRHTRAMVARTAWFTHEVGDRDVLALRLTLWDDLESDLADKDLAASWGDLAIWVGGRNITAHKTVDGDEEKLTWHFLPMLEWLAQQWDVLLHHGRLPEPTSAIDAAQAMRLIAARTSFDDIDRFTHWQWWWEQHCVRASEDGGLFPELYLRRRADKVEFSWDSRRYDYAPAGFRFLNETGHQNMAPASAEVALWSVLDAATSALVERRPESRRLSDLRRQTLSLRDASRTEYRCSLIAGIGNSYEEMFENWRGAESLGAGNREAYDATFGATFDDLVVQGSALAGVMFGSFAPTIRADDLRLITKLLIAQYPPRGGTDELRELVRPQLSPASLEDAWREGYELAEELHESLAIDTRRTVGIDDIVRRLGIETKNLRLVDSGIRGLSLWSEQHAPTMCINLNYSHGTGDAVTRFTRAHELCHLLYDTEEATELAIASGDWAPPDLERRANAFAAMFLMPRDLVQAAVAASASAPSEPEGAREIVERMAMPASAVLHHLCNLGVIDEPTRNRLVERLEIEASFSY